MNNLIKLHRAPGPIGMAAIGAGSDILGIGLEWAFGQQSAKRQVQASKQLMDYQQQKQLEMWEKTGYSAQKKQMEKAGLNPALMYGMGGGGGQTTGNASATAPMPETPNVMGIGTTAIQTALQAQLTKANIDNINADTQKKLTETPNIESQTALNKIKLEWDKIDLEIKDKSKEDAIREIWYRADKMAYEANIAEAESQERTSEETIDMRKKEITARAATAIIAKDQAELLKNKTQAEIQKINQDIKNSIEQLKLAGTQVTNDTIRTKFETNLGNRMSLEAVRALGNIINMYVTKKTGSVDNQNK